MRDAPIAVASVRSSAPTSASISGRRRCAFDSAIASSTASPARLRPAMYRSIASGTIIPIARYSSRRASSDAGRRTLRHTKIIATVGPASGSDEMLDALIAAGTDIFRLNFSHGTQQSPGETFARVRAAAQRARREVAILQDLGGPKIRTGRNKGGAPIAVKAGDRLTIETGDFLGGQGRVSTTFAGLAHGVRPGDRLLVADG